MTLQAAVKPRRLNTRPDRRRHQRVRVNLLGRFMLEDRREYPCQTIDMSPGSAALVTPITGQIGERVVAYIDHLGRLEGEIARVFDGGFAITLNHTWHKKDKLASTLTWLANRHTLNLPEDRRHERIVPKITAVFISLPDGRKSQCRIIDLSQSGAALATDIQPPLGARIHLGNIRANVVRHFEEGIAVEFLVPQTAASLEENLY